ncbi:type I restriction endonuclease subunit R [Mycoplasma parvum]|uniref:Type I restriction enzyme endonuclease subunit n=1 Tax=Mycoplasma parvum str. Indiana TaxID=1403316 RepID=U5NBY6_9MOLU|nr:HsdR family type I site-specific deoxyribonuclease [Mycoplasma parvum]AGX88907.1 hypothetical protein PRV_00705 [Mycoplasma parvum str. Indiana]
MFNLDKNTLLKKELIKDKSIETLEELGWKKRNFNDINQKKSISPILIDELTLALQKINGFIQEEQNIVKELEEFIDLKNFSLKEHKKKYKLLKDGLESSLSGERKKIKIIDFDNPENNLFTVIPDFEIFSTNDIYEKYRPDLVCFVNGLPLIFFSLGGEEKTLKEIYLENYKKIFFEKTPQLFLFNSFVVITNGKEAKMGAVGNRFEFFNHWHRLSEKEKANRNIEILLKGICEKKNFLDLFENFTVFQTVKSEEDEDEKVKKKLVKIIARNHQFLGVNLAFESFLQRWEKNGKVGTFWHTQGSGKSFSILFFTQKIIRKDKYSKNPIFVILTDRKELERQIYKTFKSCEALVEEDLIIQEKRELESIKSAEHYVFALVHKFNRKQANAEIDTGDREVVIVADEAHRTQYGDMATLMYKSFPKSSRIGFTGTPLLEDDEKTARYFGDYVSKYDFNKAQEDGVTLPLVFEERGCQIKNINNPYFNLEISKTFGEKIPAGVNSEKNLRSLGKRLRNNAKDFVDYFSERFIWWGESGDIPVIRKGMYICEDRETCILMHNFANQYWLEKISQLEKDRENAKPREQVRLDKRIDWMKSTKMKVVISDWNINERALKEIYGDEINVPEKEDEKAVEDQFKDRKDPFRIVFVCAMWLTGFDVKPLTFLFIDKVLRNHTLMQAIARPNRVDKGKAKGFIIDYIGCIQELKNSLRKYGGDAEQQEIKEDNSESILNGMLQSKGKIFEKVGNEIEKIDNLLKSISFSLKEYIEEKNYKKKKWMEEDVKKKIWNANLEDLYNEIYIKIENEISGIFENDLPPNILDQLLAIKKICKVINIKDGDGNKKQQPNSKDRAEMQKILEKYIDFKNNKHHFSLEISDLQKIIQNSDEVDIRENLCNSSKKKKDLLNPNDPRDVSFIERCNDLISKLNDYMFPEELKEILSDYTQLSKEIDERERQSDYIKQSESYEEEEIKEKGELKNKENSGKTTFNKINDFIESIEDFLSGNNISLSELIKGFKRTQLIRLINVRDSLISQSIDQKFINYFEFLEKMIKNVEKNSGNLNYEKFNWMQKIYKELKDRSSTSNYDYLRADVKFTLKKILEKYLVGAGQKESWEFAEKLIKTDKKTMAEELKKIIKQSEDSMPYFERQKILEHLKTIDNQLENSPMGWSENNVLENLINLSYDSLLTSKVNWNNNSKENSLEKKKLQDDEIYKNFENKKQFISNSDQTVFSDNNKKSLLESFDLAVINMKSFLYDKRIYWEDCFVKKGGIFRKEKEELNEEVKEKLIASREKFNKCYESLFSAFEEKNILGRKFHRKYVKCF